MESNRTLQEQISHTQYPIHEIGVEFKIYRRIKFANECRQDCPSKQFIGGAHVSEGAFPKVLDLQEFANEKIAVVHERTQLGRVSAQLLRDARTVDDVGVGCISYQLFNVARPKGHVAFAKNHIIGVPLFVEFAQTAVRARSISRGQSQ